MNGNAFIQQRAAYEGTPLVPVSRDANDASATGQTPQQFLPQPQAEPWNSDPQPSHHMAVDWNPVDATARLAGGDYLSLDLLGTIPEVSDFESGPGDETPSAPGWM